MYHNKSFNVVKDAKSLLLEGGKRKKEKKLTATLYQITLSNYPIFIKKKKK